MLSTNRQSKNLRKYSSSSGLNCSANAGSKRNKMKIILNVVIGNNSGKENCVQFKLIYWVVGAKYFVKVSEKENLLAGIHKKQWLRFKNRVIEW